MICANHYSTIDNTKFMGIYNYLTEIHSGISPESWIYWKALPMSRDWNLYSAQQGSSSQCLQYHKIICFFACFAR